jgi:7,8-dihydropterin-6-yl-methyl-4-(beta-D-ribofuranosyl)aminobenzene 5'-phosphate synthase
MMGSRRQAAKRSVSVVALIGLTVLLVASGFTAPTGTRASFRQIAGDDLRITILYDNYPGVEGLATDWGFSALIESGGDRVLFDTGTQGELLLANASRLGLDLSRIDKVVLSHIHTDHTGGLQAFLGQLDEDVRPTVYSLPSYPPEFKQAVARRGRPVDVRPFQEIIPGVYTTGEISGPVNEQALVMKTGKGLVVVTGCAHPGIVKIIETAKDHFEGGIYQVIGGFHLMSTPAPEIQNIIREFRRLGVRKVSATHCTGDEAIALFQAAYGEDYLPGGVGRVFVISNR